jgi:hypothetical protein
MPDITTSLFWIAVLQIIAIDIMLGGDNAVVIALACRKLPPEQRKKGIFWGRGGCHRPARRDDLLRAAAAGPALPEDRRRAAAVLDRRQADAAG